MSLRIRTNIGSLIAQRHLAQSSKHMAESMEKLASGHRINKAADDAAGLAIAENLRADIRSLNQSQRNANDGISLIQVAEGSFAEITNIVVRLKELAIQAASDTVGDQERGYIHQEFAALKDEVDRIALSTEFNGTRLMVGTTSLPGPLAVQASPLELQVDKGYDWGTDQPGRRNPVNIITLDLTKMNAMTEGEESLGIGSAQTGTRLDTKQEAQKSLAVLDQALEKVASHRATLGSLQNRLTSASRNLGVRMESLTEARSRIMDADFAVETAHYTQNGILQQAGASVLSQANQLPQMALKLLQ